MHTARRRDSLGWNIGSKRASMNHHAQSRELENPSASQLPTPHGDVRAESGDPLTTSPALEIVTRAAGRAVAGNYLRSSDRSGGSRERYRLVLVQRLKSEGEIEHPFQLARTSAQVAAPRRIFVACSEALVRDVQRGEHGNLQRVALRTLAVGQRHFLVDECRQFRDIARVEVAADRVPMP